MDRFLFVGVVLLVGSWVTDAQMSTDRRLCGGYMREVRDHIDFTFNENTAPPDVSQSNKYCVWTISPTVPTEQFRYNITIRNVNLDCGAATITVNFFDVHSNRTYLGTSTPTGQENPLCIDSHLVWRRENVEATTFVVILHVENVKYGQGFYMEWEEGYDSRLTPSRIRNTYYSFGKPSIAPNPYFAAGFMSNEISTFAFVKGNYSTGFEMEMYFTKISFCEGQDDWMKCFNNTMTLYSIADNGVLQLKYQWLNGTDVQTDAYASKNGFFLIAKIQDTFGAGARFTMLYDTVRGRENLQIQNPVPVILWLVCVPAIMAVRNGPSSSFVDPPQDNCRRKANKDCQELQTSTCFGVKLPYSLTSNELVNENFTQHQMQNEMRRWEGLRSVPRCWAVIQPLLCSIYMPKCSDSFIDLPPQEICRIIRKPCAAIEKALKEWPSILRCDDSSKFPAHCKHDIRELRFNTSSTCMSPLKEVENPFNYYDVIEGCALNCSDPLFTTEEHEAVSRLIKYLGVATLSFQGFLLFTSVIDWKSAKQYPSATIFYANFWYAFAVLGWMVQFLPNTKEDIVCRKDLTIRRNEPDSGEKIYCPMIFFMIYFGTMSSLAWLCVFAYVSNLTCNAVGRMRERVDKKKLYFRVFAILAPLVLTIICCSMGKIDGNSVSGVCFVGINDFSARIILLIGPLSVATILMIFYFSRGTYKLLSVTLSSSDFISDKGRKEIKSYATRVAIFTVGILVIVITSLVNQIRLMSWKPVWESSLQEQIYCKMNLNGNDAECELGEKADVNLVMADVLMFFLGGILVSSWAWTGGSLRTWNRWAKRRCGHDDNRDANHQPHMQKHRLISQAFEKRHQIPQKGRLSLSLQSTHDDPMGLNKLLDPTNLCKEDVASEMGRETDADTDINSEWAAALPHLLVRRGALVPPHSSNSVSCVSEDNSRRPSCDSGSGSVYKKSSYRNWFSRRHSTKGMRYPWRRGAGGSTSSLESNQSQILPAITALINKNQPKVGINGGGGDFDMILMGNGNTSPQKKALLVREVALQTSFERLPVERKVATCDKGIQSSLVSLQDIGTQTKKSATKKKEKRDKGGKRGKDDGGRHVHEEDKAISAKEDDDEEEAEEEDPVSKLLTPV